VLGACEPGCAIDDAVEHVHGQDDTGLRRADAGALVTFLVTVADVPIFNVGAPFWGLVIGYAVSRLLERKDFGAAGA